MIPTDSRELAASGSPARSSLVAGKPNRPRAVPPFPARGRRGIRSERGELVAEGLAVARYWKARSSRAVKCHMPFPGHRTQAQVAIDEGRG